MDHHQLALQGCGRGESRTQGCGGELTSESWSLKKEFSGIAFMLCASLRSTGQRIRGWAGSSPRTQCPGRSNAFALNLPRARARCAPCARAASLRRARSGGGDDGGEGDMTSRQRGRPRVSGIASACGTAAAARTRRTTAARENHRRPPRAFCAPPPHTLIGELHTSGPADPTAQLAVLTQGRCVLISTPSPQATTHEEDSCFSF